MVSICELDYFQNLFYIIDIFLTNITQIWSKINSFKVDSQLQPFNS